MAARGFVLYGAYVYIKNWQTTSYFEKSEVIGPWIRNNGFCNAPL